MGETLEDVVRGIWTESGDPTSGVDYAERVFALMEAQCSIPDAIRTRVRRDLAEYRIAADMLDGMPHPERSENDPRPGLERWEVDFLGVWGDLAFEEEVFDPRTRGLIDRFAEVSTRYCGERNPLYRWARSNRSVGGGRWALAEEPDPGRGVY